MLLNALSWIVIFIFCFGIGAAQSKLIYRIFGYRIRNIHGTVMSGLVFCTIYAQAFSIVYRLQQEAYFVLCAFLIISLLYAGGEIYDIIVECKKRICGNKGMGLSLFIIFASLLFLAAYISSRGPVGFDAQNYHIQCIRWLEEYGAVKGLGNLASRYAYNSSFHSLQALFSFVWTGHMSFHSMNGFLWLFITLYTVCSSCVFADRAFGFSDVLRGIFLVIIFGCLVLGFNEPLAAPITDFMPLCLSGYIFIEWCTLNELKEDCVIPYGLLAVLGLFTASVKLSAATLFILVLKPLIALIRKREWKNITIFAGICIFVIAPFVIRSVILSGYLVYPVAGLDFFNPDWKIPRSVVLTDSTAIKLFARYVGTGFTYTNIADGIGMWFPEWLRRNYPQYGILMMMDLILSVVLIIAALYRAVMKKNGTYDHIVFIGVAACFLFLFFSAPAVRFGIIWLYFLPTIFAFGVADKMLSDKGLSAANMFSGVNTGSICLPAALVIMIMCGSHFYLIQLGSGMDAKIVPEDYDHTVSEGYTYSISGYDFYYTESDEGDTALGELVGYDGFPGGFKLAYFKKMELRGSSIREGFRVKPEYRDVCYDYNGRILNEEELNVLGLVRQ